MGALRGRVLAIGGSDPSGGAGVQADLKTIAAFGAYGAAAITALTVQDTTAVQAVMMVPPDFVRAQIAAVLGDLGADAIKTGMLGEPDVVEAVCDALAAAPARVPLVVDPVLRASVGHVLLAEAALTVLKRRLLPMAALLTPNLPEAEKLAGMAIPDRAAMHHAAAALLTLGVPAVLLKGGHLPGDTVVDLLATEEGVEEFAAPRLQTRHTHGTGCTLGSAITAGLAQGMTVRDAVLRARGYVRAAIRTAPGLGAGHGPLNHGV
jgi:hydroxymethylpyrimidine/phosphomethylpyrimidine kinase